MELTASAWRAYRGDGFPTPSWRVEDEALHALGAGPRVDLVSRARYRDFALSFEWCLPPGGNSGVLYRVSEDTAEAWQSGPEMQLVDDLEHPDGQDSLRCCGALYDLIAPCARAQPLADAYVRARIVVRGWRVEHWLNDLLLLACDLADPAVRDRIARSKFAAYPRFAREPEGHLVLQHHGTDAWFRCLRIEPA